MMGLWADGWFYISSAGLLVSGILFFFLLGQYRVASEAADVTDGEQGADKEVSAPAAIRPVYIPEEAPVARIVSHSDKPEAKAEPEPKPKTGGEYTGPDRRKDLANTTGGISPAVVYLQNIKVELADLHKDLRALAKRVDDELSSVSTRDEALIARLGELTQAVENMKAAAPSPAPEEPAPAPRKARKAERIPEPEKAAEPEKAVEPEKVAEPAPAEVVVEVLPPPAPDSIPELKIAPVPDETIRMDLSALVAPEPVQPAAPVAEPEPASALPEPPPEEKPRRGPVWPV